MEVLIFIAGVIIGSVTVIVNLKCKRVGIMFIEHDEKQDHDLYHLEVNKPVELWQRKRYIAFKIDSSGKWKKEQ